MPFWGVAWYGRELERRVDGHKRKETTLTFSATCGSRAKSIVSAKTTTASRVMAAPHLQGISKLVVGRLGFETRAVPFG